MKYFYFVCSLVLLMLLPSCGKKTDRAAVLTLNGVDGMKVSASGRSFSKNPLRLKLAAGKYIFRCSAPGYRECFVPVTLNRSEKKSINVPFKKAVSAVLIESKPAGAGFTMSGKHYSTTPLTIDGLEPGEYTGVLSMPGYADQSISWRITGERPQRIYAVLSSNSGELVIRSTTPDTRIFINGKEAGIAPLRVTRVEGKYIIRAESANCVPSEQTVELKRESTKTLDFTLASKPASLTVESIPEGAAVFINGEKRGVTPCKLENMPAAEYTVLLTLPLHDPVERKTVLIAGSNETVQVTLQPGVGSCRLSLKPAGVALSLNGKPIGQVKPDPADRGHTLPVILKDLTPGEYTLTMYHELAMPIRRNIKFRVQKGKVTYITDKMWVVNCEIVYNNGEVRRGVLYAENSRDILFEFEPGARIEISRALLRSIRKIGDQ